MSRKRIKKECPLTKAGVTSIDYKNVEVLKDYLSRYNKIVPRVYSGVSQKMQKQMAAAIKRARYMALLPYTVNARA